MAWGPMGGTSTTPSASAAFVAGSGRGDALAVQSLDGALALYDCAVPGPVIALEGVLLPAPLAYVARSDSIVTLQSDNVLAGWRYRSLAAVGAAVGGVEGGGKGGGGVAPSNFPVSANRNRPPSKP